MALNTNNKRESAVNPMCPWRTVLQFPTGTVDQGERQTLMGMYSGLLATDNPPVVTDYLYTTGMILNVGRLMNR